MRSSICLLGPLGMVHSFCPAALKHAGVYLPQLALPDMALELEPCYLRYFPLINEIHLPAVLSNGP